MRKRKNLKIRYAGFFTAGFMAGALAFRSPAAEAPAVVISEAPEVIISDVPETTAAAEVIEVETIRISDTERDILARLVWSEAENQDMTGKELVACVVLNRVEQDEFPDTITEVVFEPYSFTPVWNGRYDESEEADLTDCYIAVDNVLETRTDDEIVYFCSGGFSKYGTPAYKYGDHYFSTGG